MYFKKHTLTSSKNTFLQKALVANHIFHKYPEKYKP